MIAFIVVACVYTLHIDGPVIDLIGQSLFQNFLDFHIIHRTAFHCLQICFTVYSAPVHNHAQFLFQYGVQPDAGAAAAMAAGAEEATEARAGEPAALGAGEPVRDEYELVISTTPATNVDVMRKLFEDAGTWPRELVLIADEGASFDEHYNHAFAQAWERGADAVLSMGADMPALTTADVIGGFEALHRLDGVPGGGIVLAPDQEMGVSIVGWTRATAFDHAGVFYNQEGLTVLPAYIAKARERNLPALYLPAVPDVDTMADLMHNVTLVEALNYCAAFDGNTPPWRTADALAQMGWSEVRVPPNDLHDPREEIDR